MISDSIQNSIQESMKAKDEVRLSTMKMLRSAFEYKRIELQHDLSEDDEMKVIKSEAKKRRDAIEALEKAQGKNTSSTATELSEKLEREKKELAILQKFLPEELPDTELEKLVRESIQESGAKGMADMGKVIGAVMSKAKGRADGNRVAGLVRERLEKM